MFNTMQRLLFCLVSLLLCPRLKLTAAQFAKLGDSEETQICPNCFDNHSSPAFNSISTVDVFHFDFQKNMPTKLTVGKQFYLCLLWTYHVLSLYKRIVCGMSLLHIVKLTMWFLAYQILCITAHLVIPNGAFGGPTIVADKSKIMVLSGSFKII